MKITDTRSTGLLFQALLLVSLLSAAPALQARDLEIHLGSRGGTSFSEGYINHFGHRGFALPAFGVALEISDGLLVELAYSSMQTSGDVFATYETHYFAHDAVLALRYELDWKPWLRPFARLGGGLLFEDFSIETEGGGFEASAEQIGFEIMPTLGVLLLWPTRSLLKKDGLFEKWSLGLSFELGYRYALPFDASSLTARRLGGDEAGGASVERTAIDLGRFDTQGLMVGFGLVALF